MAEIYNFSMAVNKPRAFQVGDKVRVEVSSLWGEWSGVEAKVIGTRASRFGGVLIEANGQKTEFDPVILELVEAVTIFGEVA